MTTSTPTTPSVAEAIDRYLARTSAPEFRPEAALIDMDGTLLDSMPNHAAAWYRMVTELGIPCTREEFYLYEGMTGAATINLLFLRAFHRDATDREKTELYARKTGYFTELPRPDTVPGAAEVIATLIDRGITRVLVTGSGQLNNLSRLHTDFPGGFADDMRITSRDVTHGKPAPEPYLKGMALAHTSPWQSIALENAPLGVKSASDAGAFTIAITTGPIPAEEMWKAGADLVLPDMHTLARLLPEILAGSPAAEPRLD